MKLYVFLACLCSAAMFAQTNQDRRDFLDEFDQYKTGVVCRSKEGLAIIYCPPINGTKMVDARTFDSSKPIHFGFVLMTNRASVLFILRPEYGFRISAVTETGELVTPSSKGSKFGRYFEDIEGFDKSVIDPKREQSHGAVPNWYHVSPADHVPGLYDSLPPPDELFNFKKPGKYTMRIESACFLSRESIPHIHSNSTNYYVVKFPIVELNIIRR